MLEKLKLLDEMLRLVFSLWLCLRLMQMWRQDLAAPLDPRWVRTTFTLMALAWLWR